MPGPFPRLLSAVPGLRAAGRARAGATGPRQRGPRRASAVVVAVLFVLSAAAAAAGPPAPAALALAAAPAPPGPDVRLSAPQAGKGGDLTVTGTGWRPGTLLMLLVCGRATPVDGVIGGTNSCANADGRAVTTDSEGSFSKKLPVAEPPVPCPCVVHVATVTGEQQVVDAEFAVAGHPVAPLPEQTGGGRLAVLSTTRLEGGSGLLVIFGAPPSRTLEFTVGNLGTGPVKDPVFQIGTAHGVFAPQWEEQQWRGTIKPGGKARITLPVQLSAGAHGDYSVSLKYGSKVLAEQPWGVPWPWGVTAFWILLALVVPAALFRIGMAVVDRLRPPGPRHALRAPGGKPVAAPPAAPQDPDSAPSENRPTTKGHS